MYFLTPPIARNGVAVGFLILPWLVFAVPTAGQEPPAKAKPQLAWKLVQSADVHGCAFSPDGKFLATIAMQDETSGHEKPGRITLWNVQSGKEEWCLQGVHPVPAAVAFSPDGSALAVTTHRAGVKLLDLKTRQFKWTSKEHDSFLHTFEWLAFSPDGKQLASGYHNLYVWDVATGKLAHDLEGAGYVGGAAWAPDGKTLVGCYPQRTGLWFWDAATGKDVRKIETKDYPESPVFLSKGQTLAYAGWDYKIIDEEKAHTFWRTGSGKLPFEREQAFTIIGRLAVRDLKTWKVIHTFDLTEFSIESMSVSADSKTAAIGGQTTLSPRVRKVMLYDLKRAELLWTYTDPQPVKEYPKKTVALLSGDGSHLAIIGEGRTVNLWRLAGDKQPPAPAADARVEIRGKLVLASRKTWVNERNQTVTLDTWHVAVNDMVFPLRLEKNLQALAEKYAGKDVVITGSLKSHTQKIFQKKIDFGGLSDSPPRIEFEEKEVVIPEVYAAALQLAVQAQPKADPAPKQRATHPFDGQERKVEGILSSRDAWGPLTSLTKDQKVVVADVRRPLTGATLHLGNELEHVRAVDVCFPDEKLKKKALALNGQRVEVTGEFRRLLVIPKSFGDLDVGTELSIAKGKSAWIPDSDNVKMPQLNILMYATDVKAAGPKVEPIMGEPSSKNAFGRGEWTAYTIKRLPNAQEVTALRITRDSTPFGKEELKPLTIANFPALLDGMKALKADDEKYRLWAYSPSPFNMSLFSITCDDILNYSPFLTRVKDDPTTQAIQATKA